VFLDPPLGYSHLIELDLVDIWRLTDWTLLSRFTGGPSGVTGVTMVVIQVRHYQYILPISV
jgi:hypothetical protein